MNKIIKNKKKKEKKKCGKKRREKKITKQTNMTFCYNQPIMKVAIDISPLKTGHAARGIGIYTKMLIEELKKRNDNNQYLYITSEKQIKTIQPDIIHYPFYDLFFPTGPKKQKTPILVTLHDITPLILPKLFPVGIKGKINLWIQLNRLKKVDHIITDSQKSKQDIHKVCNIPTEKITAVHLACDPSYKREEDQEKLATIKKKYQLPDKYIIKVGDINRHKNFHLLFQAIAELPQVHLVLVGKAFAQDAPLIPELQEIKQDIRKMQLQNRVHILGFVPQEDMNALYTHAIACIQNSLYEGFGLTALEAMTCGTPVIAGNTGGQPEVVQDAGILINPHSKEETVNAIKTIYNATDDEYRQRRQKAQKQAKKFSVQKMADEVITLYEQYKK